MIERIDDRAKLARKIVCAIPASGARIRPARMLAAISAPRLTVPSDTRKTPRQITPALTDCCTKTAAEAVKFDQLRVCAVTRDEAATAFSHSRCNTGSAPMLLTVSSPVSDSMST